MGMPWQMFAPQNESCCECGWFAHQHAFQFSKENHKIPRKHAYTHTRTHTHKQIRFKMCCCSSKTFHCSLPHDETHSVRAETRLDEQNVRRHNCVISRRVSMNCQHEIQIRSAIYGIFWAKYVRINGKQMREINRFSRIRWRYFHADACCRSLDCLRRCCVLAFVRQHTIRIIESNRSALRFSVNYRRPSAIIQQEAIAIILDVDFVFVLVFAFSRINPLADQTRRALTDLYRTHLQPELSRKM